MYGEGSSMLTHALRVWQLRVLSDVVRTSTFVFNQDDGDSLVGLLVGDHSLCT